MDLIKMARDKEFLRRFLSKFRLNAENGCWDWIAGTDSGGYGAFGKGRAHVVAYFLWNGPIPKGLHVRHKCDRPGCVNPRHLLLGTPADNAQDSVDRGRAPKGSQKVNAKLDEQKVNAIRRAIELGEKQQAIADRYGVARQQVSAIKHGKIWRHA